MKQMKCLITGGAGFIGSHIQDKLIELGHDVAILDNLRSGKTSNLHPSSKFYNIDIRDKQKVMVAFKEFRPSVVFHLAAQNEVPYSMKDPYEDQDINIRGTMSVLDAAAETKAKVIYSNTGGVYYGEVSSEKFPIVEDELVLKPTCYYGVSKLCAEMYIKLWGNLTNLPWVSLRYSNVYGPRQDGNKEAGVVAIFTSLMLAGKTPIINGSGAHTRDYVYVMDVVDANIKAMAHDQSDYFNISTGIGTSVQEVFDAIESELQTGSSPTYGPERPGDPLHVALSCEKASKLLGWEPKFAFKDGVKETISYYKSLQI